MCMEDKRIGRETGGAETSASVPVTVVEILGPSPNRVALKIYAPNTDAVFVSACKGIAAGSGIRLAPGYGPILMRIEEFGELVRGSWYASSATATVQVIMHEGFLAKQ